MNIAYVAADPGVRIFGRTGSSIHVQEVVRAFLAAGASVDLFATRIAGDPPSGLEAVVVHRLPKRSGGEPEVKERAALAANDHLRAALEAAGTFDLVYERQSLFCYASMEFASQRGIRGLLEVNAPLIDEQRRYRGLVLEGEAERAETRAFRAASALVAVSDGVAEYLNRHPAARGRVHVVPNGVDPARFASTPPRLDRPDEGSFTVGFVGTLKPWHGVEKLIDAVADLHQTDPGVRLLVVGDGPQRADLETRVEARGLGGAARFTGVVDPESIPAWLAAMDVAVAPYPKLPDFYFSPLKIFEYMAAGRPIVAAAIGQIKQMISGGETGLLYPPGDTPALTAALHRLKIDPALRHRIGEAARRTAVANHTWHAVASRILALAELPAPNSHVPLRAG